MQTLVCVDVLLYIVQWLACFEAHHEDIYNYICHYISQCVMRCVQFGAAL